MSTRDTIVFLVKNTYHNRVFDNEGKDNKFFVGNTLFNDFIG